MVGIRAAAATSILLVAASQAVTPQAPEKEALAAMRRATDFMMNTVSNRGGFLWHYTADLSKQWGEVPARKSQIWVQPPGTPTVGLMLLDAYRVTKDADYLRYADRVAGALIWGQHPEGGWHYLIDFDPSGLQKWYDEVASQCRGWEEFYHYYGNAAFDDDTTASAARFLLRLYAETLDPRYRPAVDKALNFVLKSQYANGAWPQRYPLRYEFAHDGHSDYTSYYTFNDGVIPNNIYLLLEAYEKLGNEEYRTAARRGMDFYILSQLPAPQAGWAEQYDLELRPAWARSYEPPAVASYMTAENIKDLENFYCIAGDRRYLRPIPDAIQWLEASILTGDTSTTHATYYEPVTNKPLYRHHSHQGDSRKEILRYWIDYDPRGVAEYDRQRPIDVKAIRAEYLRISKLSREDALAGYRRQKESQPYHKKIDAAEARELIGSLDARGAWIMTVRFIDTLDYMDNPPTVFEGIDTRTYVGNMYKLMSYVRAARGGG